MEIINNTNGILSQLNEVVRSLTSNEFTKPLGVLNQSTIGQHIRHIIEFYVEFDNGYIKNVVCYDNRKRNPDFESNRDIIISKINDINDTLKAYDLTKDIKIKSNHGLNDSECTLSSSSVMRELVYALDHTVHHLAIIKIGMQVEFPHINLSKDMGIAPSTLRNNSKVCVQ